MGEEMELHRNIKAPEQEAIAQKESMGIALGVSTNDQSVRKRRAESEEEEGGYTNAKRRSSNSEWRQAYKSQSNHALHNRKEGYGRGRYGDATGVIGQKEPAGGLGRSKGEGKHKGKGKGNTRVPTNGEMYFAPPGRDAHLVEMQTQMEI